MVRAGLIPPAPEEMRGMELNVEFVSMLAQAQRAIGTNGVDRFIGSLGVISQMKPDVLDKLNADNWVDAYSDMLGVDPRLIVPGDQVAILREARNQAMAAKEQQEMMLQQATAVNKLGNTPSSGNVLSDAVNMFSGYSAPTA